MITNLGGLRRPAEPPAPRWRWHGWAGALVLAWLAVSAGLAGAAAIGSPMVPSWLAVHTLLLGAATTAIVVWSEHFAIAVTRAPGVNKRWSTTRLGVLTTGQVCVVSAAVAELTWLLAAGAVLVTIAVAAHGVVLWRLRSRGLGGGADHGWHRHIDLQDDSARRHLFQRGQLKS